MSRLISDVTASEHFPRTFLLREVLESSGARVGMAVSDLLATPKLPQYINKMKNTVNKSDVQYVMKLEPSPLPVLVSACGYMRSAVCGLRLFDIADILISYESIKYIRSFVISPRTSVTAEHVVTAPDDHFY